MLMPGNYITQKKHLPPEKVQQYLTECDGEIAEIVAGIRQKEDNYREEKHSFLMSYGLHKLAVLEKTEKFVFGEACVGCGKCTDICPMEAIHIKNGKPAVHQSPLRRKSKSTIGAARGSVDASG